MSVAALTFLLNANGLHCQQIDGDIATMTGYDITDFLSGQRRFDDLFHEDDQDICDEIFSHRPQTSSRPQTCRFYHKSGEVKILSLIHYKRPSSEGKETIILLTCQLPERRSEDILGETAMTNYLAMLENTDDYIYFKDRNHLFTCASQTLVKITDPSERWTDLIGKTDYEVFPKEFADIYFSLEKKVFSGQLSVAQDVQPILGHEGNKGWVDNRKYPIKDERGNIIGLFGVARDITELKQTQEALARSEKRYRAAFHSSFDAISISRVSDGLFLDVNQPFLDTFGFKLDEVIGYSALDIHIWDSVKDRQHLVESVQRDGTCIYVDVPLRRKSGELFWGVVSAVVIELDGTSCLFIFTRDITERKRAEAALRVGEERYRSVFQTSLDGISITRISDGVILDVNQSYLDLYGYRRTEVVGKTPLELGVWRELAERQRFMEILRREGRCRNFECLSRKKSGELFWVVLSATAIEVGDVPCILTYQKDITERKRSEEKIYQLAFYDQLTALPNRTLLRERIKQAVEACAESGRHGALLLIDLDNFKTLNDTLGHDMGDILLQQVAQRLIGCVREEDTVARLGGDEFVVMLVGLSEVESEAASQVEQTGRKIHIAFTQSFQLKGISSRITPSVGASLFGGGDVDIDALIKQSDLAMYRVKETGRNSIRFFEPDMAFAVMHRAKLEGELREAIDNRQFILHYQSQIADGEIVGAEALVRWMRPARGLVSPAEFIPLAEENGLILPLGQWILEAACKQLAAWAKRPEMAHLTIAVNVSARQFRQPDFVDQVQVVLGNTGANPHRLKLELTESLLASDLDEVAEKMFVLKSKGVGFSLDDFGTGYSSLSYLKLLPLDQLKIDRTFVRDVLIDPNDAAIATTIITLAQSLGLGVIAEGVETASQREFLANAGCHAYQGYFFSRPLPIEAFEKQVLQG